MCDNQAVNGETRNGGCKFQPSHIWTTDDAYFWADSEYTILRSEAVVRVPDHVDAAKYSPILCAGMTVFNSMRHMNVGPGETVAVQGLGGLGHLAIQYAHRFGYRVVAISRDSSKEKFARELGAHDYIDSSKGDTGEQLQKLGGAKLIIATAPTADVMTPLLKGLGILGKLLILSVPGDVPISTGTMVSCSAVSLR
jgi:D-arabinose 1-dehydrogenase-like Zn-dependent alcohol dehydrogenase